MKTLTPDDFDYDTDMGCLSIGLDKFSQDDDATPYDSFHRLQEQLLENQKDSERLQDLINWLEEKILIPEESKHMHEEILKDIQGD